MKCIGQHGACKEQATIVVMSRGIEIALCDNCCGDMTDGDIRRKYT